MSLQVKSERKEKETTTTKRGTTKIYMCLFRIDHEEERKKERKKERERHQKKIMKKEFR